MRFLPGTIDGLWEGSYDCPTDPTGTVASVPFEMALRERLSGAVDGELREARSRALSGPSKPSEARHVVVGRARWASLAFVAVVPGLSRNADGTLPEIAFSARLSRWRGTLEGQWSRPPLSPSGPTSGVWSARRLPA